MSTDGHTITKEELSLYVHVFTVDPQGVKAFEKLKERFYDIPSYTVGDSDHTNYIEGQRSVIDFLNLVVNEVAEDVAMTKIKEQK